MGCKLAEIFQTIQGWCVAMCVFVANFFALILPTGATMVATLIALAGSALIFALCLWLGCAD